MKFLSVTFILALLCSFLPGHLLADWPQWRHDAQRSGVTKEAGPGKGNLSWQWKFKHPDPAYEHQYQMCADSAFAPVCADGLVFIPLNVSDQVVAIDLKNGAIRWRFYADAPVRYAAIYHNKKLYFGADDGYLYCVSADSGNLIWKKRGVPDKLPDSRMLINKRICSRWPVRGAPVLGENGVLYFGAGIWPEEGSYVSAIDAESGTLKWRSDKLSLLKEGFSDHNGRYELSLPPQGYMALIGGSLAVACGRAPAPWFDPANGKMEAYTTYYTKTSQPHANWYVAGNEDMSVQAGNWFWTAASKALPLPKNTSRYASGESYPQLRLSSKDKATLYDRRIEQIRPFIKSDIYYVHNPNLYTEPVIDGTISYTSELQNYAVGERGRTYLKDLTYTKITARDIGNPKWVKTTSTANKRRKKKKGKGKEKSDDSKGKNLVAGIEFPLLWQIKSPLKVLIKAGQRLYAGSRGRIASIIIKKDNSGASLEWEQKISGAPVHALVSDGRLLVSTDMGEVCCFSEQAAPAKSFSAPGLLQPEESTQPVKVKDLPPIENNKDKWKLDKRRVIAHTWAPAQKGYALLLGWPGIDEIKKLTKDNTYQVVIMEPDKQTAQTARKALDKEGLYGLSAQVLETDYRNTMLTPYWASRIVVSKKVYTKTIPEKLLRMCLDLLHPYLGHLYLPFDAGTKELAEKLCSADTRFRVTASTSSIYVQSTDAPKGSGVWTHESAGPDNSFASSENNVKWPLGLLWYSGSIDDYFTPTTHFQHQRNPYPLVVGGRMFVQTGNILHSIDIYTGRYLWQARMKLTPWLGNFFKDARYEGRATERHIVAAADEVYVVTGSEIDAFNTQNGMHSHTIKIPNEIPGITDQLVQKQISERGIWREVRVYKNLLFAVIKGNLVAIDRKSGTLKWKRTSKNGSFACAIGDDRLFALDYIVPKREGKGPNKKVEGVLQSLQYDSGKMEWKKEVSYLSRGNRLTGANIRIFTPTVVPDLIYNKKHKLIVMVVDKMDIRVFSARSRDMLWSKIQNPKKDTYNRLQGPIVADDWIRFYRANKLTDIKTGKELPDHQNAKVFGRGCSRVLGSNNVIVNRAATVGCYDVINDRDVKFNSVRAGCQTSLIPAGGIMVSPNLAQGCVCSVPMFASQALFHMPGVDAFRPASVLKASHLKEK